MALEKNCFVGRVTGIGSRIAIFIGHRHPDRALFHALSRSGEANCRRHDLGGRIRARFPATVRVLFLSLESFLVGDGTS